jgi:hypothetical protein
MTNWKRRKEKRGANRSEGKIVYKSIERSLTAKVCENKKVIESNWSKSEREGCEERG